MIADIYHSQNEVLLQEGLTGTIDEDDFKAEPDSIISLT